MRKIIPILILGLFAACGDGTGLGGAGGGARASKRVAEASYGRHLVFVSGSAEAPRAAVFDFAILLASDSIYRTARVWLGQPEGWTRLFDSEWSDAPMREPWRLVPHGPLRLVVDDAGEIDALLLRTDSLLRLSTMPPRGEWSPTEALRFRVRQAGLDIGGEALAGVLLDVHAGAEGAMEGAPGKLFVTDGSGLLLVVSDADGSPAWLRSGAREETFDSVSVAPLDSVGADGWRIDAPGGGLSGEIVIVGTPLGATGTSSGIGLVRGWLEVRGERRDIFGVARRGRRRTPRSR